MTSGRRVGRSGLTPLKCYLLAMLATALLHSSFARAALIELQPETALASTGDSLSLDVVISGLGDTGPVSLGAFDISFGFDDAVLAFTGYILGSKLGDVGLAEAIDASTGSSGSVANVAEVSLLSAPDLDLLQSATFAVATLHFDVIGLGAGVSTQIDVLQGAVLADAFGSQISVSGLGSASVVGVPVPDTLMLLAASLCGWVSSKRTPVRRVKSHGE